MPCSFSEIIFQISVCDNKSTKRNRLSFCQLGAPSETERISRRNCGNDRAFECEGWQSKEKKEGMRRMACSWNEMDLTSNEWYYYSNVDNGTKM